MIGDTQVLSRMDVCDRIRGDKMYGSLEKSRVFASDVFSAIEAYCARENLENGTLIPMEHEGMNFMVGTLPVMLPNKHGGFSEKSSRYPVMSQDSFERALSPKLQETFGNHRRTLNAKAAPPNIPVQAAKAQGFQPLSEHFSRPERTVIEAAMQQGLRADDGTGDIHLGGSDQFPIRAARASLGAASGKAQPGTTFYMIHSDSAANARAWLDAELKTNPRFVIEQEIAIRMARANALKNL